MKTSVLKAYNEYVVLVNRYHNEKPMQLMKHDVLITAKKNHELTAELVLQDQYLQREATILWQNIQLAHLEFARALMPNGFELGSTMVTVPKTYPIGNMVVAPRYQKELNEALQNGDEDTPVPVEDKLVHVYDDGYGTPLVYSLTGHVTDYLPYPLFKPTPQLS